MLVSIQYKANGIDNILVTESIWEHRRIDVDSIEPRMAERGDGEVEVRK